MTERWSSPRNFKAIWPYTNTSIYPCNTPSRAYLTRRPEAEARDLDENTCIITRMPLVILSRTNSCKLRIYSTSPYRPSHRVSFFTDVDEVNEVSHVTSRRQTNSSVKVRYENETSINNTTERRQESNSIMTSDSKMGKTALLKAIYQAPRTSQETTEPPARVFTKQLSAAIPPSDEHSPAGRTAYLAELRGSIVSLQADVNTFLTEKMEEDKLRDIQQGGATTDDKTEEDNYGEEVVNDDE
ncbi:hypothetical protein MGYG_02528 [Nannizzia gypsea CBS 118893]|uniref:EKC/KEOPS complex subunit GON7 n=1 Tax=Arthroderma gypseum (strain ATCC MYA-4604 / CBS 118893) TaxID=535722 RepID=E4UN00_ARTGP|nr:hypothetical protein MGYG_02528 [Nannizzia gypsea CBS 118893]EFQ99514.1 hypothetical protein MGYG_02528 [Nannizzia gypsea CBS 118893]